ncbi:hypothetical protein [Tardiphaga sp.]|uniref:hypothetical protein n=1 Tax=Tardiphaga sp. TaxID=1926292 RepID=UPI002636EB8B|nr:hypothetical protein [Tardiphaga sp.]MDB5620761.1 putative tail length tape measure protein [Tardiphaga sp.]
MLGIGARASGGPVSAGQAYVVGENRPELFVPNQSGTIIPQIPTARSGGGGAMTDARSYSIDARGSQMTEQQFRAILQEHGQQTLRTAAAQAPMAVMNYKQRFG